MALTHTYRLVGPVQFCTYYPLLQEETGQAEDQVYMKGKDEKSKKHPSFVETHSNLYTAGIFNIKLHYLYTVLFLMIPPLLCSSLSLLK